MFCRHCGSQLAQGATFCSGCGNPVATGPARGTKTTQERRELLARLIAGQVPRGWRVESQSEFQAVLVSGRPINHVLHLILTLITCSLWGLAWASLAFFGGEKRQIANVDEWGNITISRVGGSTAKVIAAIAVCAPLFLIVAIVISVASASETVNGQSSQSNTNPTLGSPTAEPAIQVNAEQILSDYKENETAANFNWKGKRLLVTLDGIDEIEDGGRVLKYLGSFGIDYIEMDFNNVRDVIDLVPGNSVTANCRLEGFQMDSWLEFNDCYIE